MIFFFSGTGNSEYVAREFGEILNEEVVKITDISPYKVNYSGNSLGFVFPVYSWGVPPLLLSYIRSLSEKFVEDAGMHKIWMVCVCGDETARAPEMLKKVLGERGLKISGGWSIMMPNNYVLLPGFDVDHKMLESCKIDVAASRIPKIAEMIAGEKWVEAYIRGSKPRLKSSLVYPLFKRWGIFPSKWHSTEECISCGKCEKVCPVCNVCMQNGKPKWGTNCVSCLACYHICPRHAVQYGRATRKKGQYFMRR